MAKRKKLYDDPGKLSNGIKPPLKKCPFCGGRGKMKEQDISSSFGGCRHKYWVECANSKCHKASILDDRPYRDLEGSDKAKIKAINKWNKRLESPPAGEGG